MLTLQRHGTPEIFNTDQGAQFTSEAFRSALKEHGTRISMDGKGCYHDNIFMERLWRSVKHECVYLTAFEDGQQLKQALHRYLTTTMSPVQPASSFGHREHRNSEVPNLVVLIL